MERNIPMTCNLRFNAKNPHHVHTAQVLATLRPKEKTAFVAMAVAAYMEAHPTGIDMNELMMVRKARKRCTNTGADVPKPRQSARESRQEPDISAESREAIQDAMDFYEID